MVHQSALLIIFTFVASVAATNGNCFSITNNGNNRTMCKGINIACPSGRVIYNPNIVASSEDCSDKNASPYDSEMCVGIPPDLLAQINECYWKQTCFVRFPAAPLFNLTEENHCLAKAMSLRVNTLKCIRTESNDTIYRAICNTSTEIGPKASSGIILSHTYIPWNYKSSIFDKQNGVSKNLECSININIRNDHITFIRTEVYLFDIDTENDKLVIDGKNIKESGVKRNHKKNSAVTVNFTSNGLYSKSGSGFVICFKTDDKADHEDASACKDLIMECEGIVTLATSPDESCEDFIWTDSSCKKTRKKVRKTSCDIKDEDNLKKFCDKCPGKWGACKKIKNCRKCCKKYSKKCRRGKRKNKDQNKRRKKNGRKNKAKSRNRNGKNGNN